jgi:predicted dehydrogenase
MRSIRIAVLGAGGRGNAYGDYLLRHPAEGRVVAVAEPDERRRALYAQRHGLIPEAQFPTWQELLDRRPEAEAVFVTTQDRMHVEPTLKALALGYDVLLEKPIAPDPADCMAIAEAAERSGRNLAVCHVLRYTPFFQTVKQLLESGRIGRLVSVQWTENVGWFHMAHSFVRGNWRNAGESNPMILAKSCHDLDAIAWLVGEPCTRLSSFGSLTHFRPENAPPGAPDRCTDGCPAEATCPYSAPAIYLHRPEAWLKAPLTTDRTPEGLSRALAEGPYGRCVYRCDNDVVDHQVVNLEFAGGVTASFTMVGFTAEIARTLKLFGTHGEMRCHMELGEIEINDFLGRQDRIRPAAPTEGHGGGDDGLMRTFLHQLRTGDARANLSPARVSAETHLLAFAAEESRLTGRTIDFPAYVAAVPTRGA